MTKNNQSLSVSTPISMNPEDSSKKLFFIILLFSIGNILFFMIVIPETTKYLFKPYLFSTWAYKPLFLTKFDYFFGIYFSFYALGFFVLLDFIGLIDRLPSYTEIYIFIRVFLQEKFK